MNRQEIEKAHPGCVDAVLYHEDPMLEDIWPLIRSSEQSPPVVVRILTEMAKQTLNMIPGESLGKVYPQMSHPDFLRYVAAKLGAM